MATLVFKLDQLFILLVPELVVWFENVRHVRFPSEPDFVQNYNPIGSKFVVVMKCPLLTNPIPQRLILLVSLWHHAMAILSFRLDQLFMLMVPGLVAVAVAVVGAFSFPSEPDSVEKFFAAWSHFVACMLSPLRFYPKNLSSSLFLPWHQTMALLLLKLDQLLKFLVPVNFFFPHGSLLIA
jgi:hypothetical protein